MKSRKRKEVAPLPVIGWREWLSLPLLGIDKIKAKVDTGARSSSLHAWDVELVRRGGRELVRFKVHPIQRDPKNVIEAEAPLLGMRRVRNSGGRVEERPVIVTEVSLMDATWPIELTLTRRDLLGFRMLLGRQAVRGRFTVDPSRSFYDGRLSRQRRMRYKEREA